VADDDIMTNHDEARLVSDIRVLIVGCGRMGRTRARACLQAGANVGAVLDVDRPAARALATECGTTHALNDVEQVDWSQIDAIVVSTPPAERVPAIMAALRAGVPVFMEKPVGLNAPAVQEITSQLQRRPTITAVGYMNRYRPSVLRLRDELESRPVFAVTSTWVAPPYEKPWWHETGGPLRDYATHLLDLCRFVVGDIAEVSTLITQQRNDVGWGESAALSLRFVNGACGTVFTSALGTEKHISFDVFFEGGVTTLLGWDLRRSGAADDPVSAETIFARETLAFLAAVCGTSRSAPLCDFQDALRTQLVVDAAYASAASGRTQSLV
jgi:myo-inositol 2-dehydrogenase/D-chiro-inositol 1-dehydrogenase